MIPLLDKKKNKLNLGLYIVSTPIGNLNDLSSRALNILKNVFLVACEDTRQTKKIMSRYEISNKMISFNIVGFRNWYIKSTRKILPCYGI